jgi:hypothetical protein
MQNSRSALLKKGSLTQSVSSASKATTLIDSIVFEIIFEVAQR